MDEQALLARAQAGDGEAFGQLYDQHFDDVFRYTAALTADRHAAEDLTADTFLRALRAVRHLEYRGPGSVRVWLVTIARNLVRDRATSGRRRREVPAGLPADWWRQLTAPPVDVEAVQAMEDRRILAAVRALPWLQRQCVALRFFAELSTAETAAVMRTSETAVKALQYRAVRGLRRRLAAVERPPGRPSGRTAPSR